MNNTINYSLNFHINTVFQRKHAPPTWARLHHIFQVSNCFHRACNISWKVEILGYFLHKCHGQILLLVALYRGSMSNIVVITACFHLFFFLNNFFSYNHYNFHYHHHHRRHYFHITFSHVYPTQLANHVITTQCVSIFRLQYFNKP